MERSPASTIEEANTALIVKGDVDAADRYFTADYVAHLTDRDLDRGPDAVRRFVDGLRRGFSDLQVEVEILLEGQGRIAWQRTVRGIHSGDFLGFPATGRQVVWREMFTSRFRDDMIAEDWAVTELAERLLLSRKR
jgi:predicted ester cyclase